MIDLRNKVLPSKIEADGTVYELYTDFRVWLEFNRLHEEEGVISPHVLKGEPKGTEWETQALLFLSNPNSTPNYTSGSSRRGIDYIEDGEYIVASFQQAYGIDLTSCEYMHWHRFKALVIGLPSNTKMAEIIDKRMYRKSNKKPETIYAEEERAWRLPDKNHERELAEARRIAAELYERESGVNDG